MEPGAGQSSDTASGLVFACIAPHGGYAIPEACGPHEKDLAPLTQAGMLELGRRCDAADPETLIVLTPHGIHVEGHFAVVTAGRLAGSLEDTPDVAFDVPVDLEVASQTLAALREAGIPAVGVSFGGNVPEQAVMPMDWGTLIPLWYLGGRHEPPRPVVVIAPARDLPLESHVDAGAAIVRAIEATGRRVALVCSADQSHTHLRDGPYGFDPGARVLDDQIVAILREDRLPDLIGLDAQLVEAAKPDSWWQMLMLLGAIGDRWRPELISYEAPTYYGMCCAAFTPRGAV